MKTFQLVKLIVAFLPKFKTRQALRCQATFVGKKVKICGLLNEINTAVSQLLLDIIRLLETTAECADNADFFKNIIQVQNCCFSL